jgi:hypothetical protein
MLVLLIRVIPVFLVPDMRAVFRHTGHEVVGGQASLKVKILTAIQKRPERRRFGQL